MSEENKALVRGWFEEIDRRKELPTELCDPGFTAHLPGQPPMDLEAYRQFIAMMYGALSNIAHTYEDFVAEGDRVCVRYVARGVHTGELMGVPASGSRVAVTDICMVRVAGGKIAEFWASPDMMGLMQQIGALPAPDQVESA